LDDVAKYGETQRVEVRRDAVIIMRVDNEIFISLSPRVIIRNAFFTQGGKDAPKTLDVIRRTVVYMENDIFGPSPTHDLSEEILAECTNKEALCAYWAVIGGEDCNFWM
jgi:hypothetical protein